MADTDKRATLDENGHEVPNFERLVVPLGYKRPADLAEQVQRLVRHSLEEYAALQQKETFEDSEDFDTGEDDTVGSPYEEVFDPILGRSLTPDEFRRHEAEYKRKFVENLRKEINQQDRLETFREKLRRKARQLVGDEEAGEVPAPKPKRTTRKPTPPSEDDDS